jgi:hypothetical protein
MPKHLFRGVLAIVGALLISGAVLGQSAPTAAAFLKMVATHNSKTISLPQIDAFAKKKFGKLKKTGEKALSMADLSGRMSQADLDAANTKHGNSSADPTLSRTEFLAYVGKLFTEANTVGQKTLSETELNTPAGEKLITLLQ